MLQDNFIAKAEEKIKRIVAELGWNYEDLLKNQEKPQLQQCPYNDGHLVSPECFDEHVEKCEWTSSGYRPWDKPLSEVEPSSYSVVFTPESQEEVLRKAADSNPSMKRGSSYIRPIPRTSNRLVQCFTSDERLALYNYVVANTDKPNELPDVEFKSAADSGTREKTAKELAAVERDAKRRRATYRNKVHTNRKTQVEVLREVIESQMSSLFEEYTDARCSDRSTKKTDQVIEGRNYVKDLESADKRSSNPNTSWYHGSEPFPKPEERHTRGSTEDNYRQGPSYRDQRRDRYDSKRKEKSYEGQSKWNDGKERSYEEYKYSKHDVRKDRYYEKSGRRRHADDHNHSEDGNGDHERRKSNRRYKNYDRSDEWERTEDYEKPKKRSMEEQKEWHGHVVSTDTVEPYSKHTKAELISDDTTVEALKVPSSNWSEDSNEQVAEKGKRKHKKKHKHKKKKKTRKKSSTSSDSD